MRLSYALRLGVSAATALCLTYGAQNIVALRADNSRLHEALQTQIAARHAAEWLLNSERQITEVFAAVRAANLNARHIAEKQRNEVKKKIAAAAQRDAHPCTAVAVPAAVADQLRRLERAVRAAGDAH